MEAELERNFDEKMEITTGDRYDEEYVIGIDVGTGSVRGALVEKDGRIAKISIKDTTTWNPRPNIYQQSSNEIWLRCCEVIKELIKDIIPENVKGLGFDATSSVVVCDDTGNSVAVDLNGTDDQNVILWLDHRARNEATIIDETNHPILKYVGGNISPEWMIPKILWLKRNHPECWRRAAYYFLLPDFLTWKATGEDSRSLCSVTGGCNYLSTAGKDSGWVKSYFDAIGLGELHENNWKKIGSKIKLPGELCGRLNSRSAQETGLPIGTPVAVSLIDGQCGGLGLIGCHVQSLSSDLTSRLVAVCGTSTNYVYHSSEQFSVSGTRGPFYSAVLPNLWLLIAGQSASGKLIDYIVDSHPASKLIRMKYPNVNITTYLNGILNEMSKREGLNSFDELTKDVHVYPDFHGNRTPFADPNLCGMMLGLTLENDENHLARWYLATIQALAYSAKYIIEELQRESINHEKINSLLICGGLSKNEIFVRTHANAVGLPIFLPERTESVLLGSSMLAATVSGFYPDLTTAAVGMAGSAKQIVADPRVNEKKRKIAAHSTTVCRWRSTKLADEVSSSESYKQPNAIASLLVYFTFHMCVLICFVVEWLPHPSSK